MLGHSLQRLVARVPLRGQGERGRRIRRRRPQWRRRKRMKRRTRERRGMTSMVRRLSLTPAVTQTLTTSFRAGR
ncbi:hypothetical protein Dimus_038494 [Dionaea muscipula]